MLDMGMAMPKCSARAHAPPTLCLARLPLLCSPPLPALPPTLQLVGDFDHKECAEWMLRAIMDDEQLVSLRRALEDGVLEVGGRSRVGLRHAHKGDATRSCLPASSTACSPAVAAATPWPSCSLACPPPSTPTPLPLCPWLRRWTALCLSPPPRAGPGRT